jgi:AraC-like DNA-binding protein
MNIKIDSTTSIADVTANVIRGVMHFLILQGYKPERVCGGLGISVDDLKATDVRVSYRQTSIVIRRAMRLLKDAGIGIACGSRQTLISFGIPGLGMLTCKTLGEAIAYLDLHQRDAGSVMINEKTYKEKIVIYDIRPRFHDPELEPFLTEEHVASVVTLIRNLIGQHYKPIKLELAYAAPEYAKEYRHFFKCPIEFDKPATRIYSSLDWFEMELLGYESLTSEFIRSQLDTLMAPARARVDLEESISGHVRHQLHSVPDFQHIADLFHVSERTLRRRLDALNLTYQGIIDKLRYETSLVLLRKPANTLSEIAAAVGFSDVRNFRRAFKRWSGLSPTDYQKNMKKS